MKVKKIPLGAERFRITLNIDIIEDMASVGCSKADVCGFFRVSEDYLDNWLEEEFDVSWSELANQRLSARRYTLRKQQFALAQKNVMMSIFLGKNLLGQQAQPVALPEFSGGLKEIVTTLRNRLEEVERRKREAYHGNEENPPYDPEDLSTLGRKKN